MKKQLFVLCLLLTLFACKNGEEKDQDNTEINAESLSKAANETKYKSFSGEFIYVADGAVLKGKNFIYGVTIDDKMKELAKMVDPVKKDEFDMVPVKVKGELVANPLFAETGEGWRLNVTIKEIINVSDTPSPADVKIEENKTK